MFRMIYSYVRLRLTIQPVFRDKESVIEVMKVFDRFSLFPDLKPNQSKCKISDTVELLKGVSPAPCGLECIDLTNKPLKSLIFTFFIIKSSKMRKAL